MYTVCVCMYIAIHHPHVHCTYVCNMPVYGNLKSVLWPASYCTQIKEVGNKTKLKYVKELCYEPITTIFLVLGTTVRLDWHLSAIKSLAYCTVGQ